jgi:adenosylcobinamide kinase/adenosylcobinamide-phosphate guanylyltransferase
LDPGPRLQLVTGAARSGKSRWAEHLASAHAGPVLYCATAEDRPQDPAWQARLEAHRLRRPQAWRLREVQADLAAVLAGLVAEELALVDALGTWVAWGLAQNDAQWRHSCDAFTAALTACRGRVIVVSEQTGWGVVPTTVIGGRFRDRLGALEQEVALLCGRCWLVVSGRALDLTSLSQPVPR